MNYIAQLIFIAITGVAGYFAFKNFKIIFRNIRLGKPANIDGNKSEHLRNMILVALGQKKMFKKWIPAMLHLFIYVAFLITQIELIEIILDGLLGTHRIIYKAIESTVFSHVYTLVINSIEVLSLLGFIATIAFLSRRNLLKVPRLIHNDLNGWPKLDGNIILFLELTLIIGIFSMNIGDKALQYQGINHTTGNFLISGFLSQFVNGLDAHTLHILERFGWWLHYFTVLGFLNYIPFSKHLHVLFAFPNTYFASTKPRGEMPNMPAITREIKLMLDPSFDAGPEPTVVEKFGAKDVMDLSWISVLSAFTCTECGRCTNSCPANITGKKLSPRKIMMSVRDRAEEIGKNLDNNTQKLETYNDGKSLHDYITKEEILACTSCNACVEECPVLISPLAIINEMRRYKIMEEADSPSEWNTVFGNMENNGAPWKFAATDRLNWAEN
jgi:heterodisulfide reductase subunit C